jgi:hypothetical protein
MAFSTHFLFKENQLEQKTVERTFEAKSSTDSENTMKCFSCSGRRMWPRKYEEIPLNLWAWIYKKINSQQQRLLIVDVTGTTILQHKHSRVTRLKGKGEVGKLTSGEGRCLLTIFICTNAVAFTFLRRRSDQRKTLKLMDGAPAGSWVRCRTHFYHFVNSLI